MHGVSRLYIQRTERIKQLLLSVTHFVIYPGQIRQTQQLVNVRKLSIRIAGDVDALQGFFYDLMAHKSNIQKALGFQHGMCSLQIILGAFQPIPDFCIIAHDAHHL